MTLFETVRNLEEIAAHQPNVRTVGDGDLFEFMTNPSLKYGIFYVTQTSHRSTNTSDFYTLNLYYIDRLEHNLESNYLQVQSVGVEVLRNIIMRFCDEFDVDLNEINFNTFTEKFLDECGGAYSTVTFEIIRGITCSEDYD